MRTNFCFREVELFDGTKLVNQSHYDHLRVDFSEEELKEKGIFCVDPSFRMIFVGDLPNKKNYITEELLQMLSWHHLDEPSANEKFELLSLLEPKAEHSVIKKLLHFVSLLEEYKKKSSDIKITLSIRQLVRILNKVTSYDGKQDDILYHSIKQNCYYQLLPTTSKQIIEKFLQTSNIKKSQLPKIVKKNRDVQQETEINPKSLHLVPKVLFYDIDNHLEIIDQLKHDFDRGSHILMVGNQGVAKNRITDKFLSSMVRFFFSFSF